ncbi:tRNA pseudouridine synthase [Nymphaea thermarum]|nr:tRNA pseudouridine synthase [Nymphaea thermarum]
MTARPNRARPDPFNGLKAGQVRPQTSSTQHGTWPGPVQNRTSHVTIMKEVIVKYQTEDVVVLEHMFEKEVILEHRPLNGNPNLMPETCENAAMMNMNVKDRTGRWARTTFKIVVSYHGASFDGWQKQPNLNTVQGSIEDALGRFVDEKKAMQLRDKSLPVQGCAVVAGRTDKGVTALQQVSCSPYHPPILMRGEWLWKGKQKGKKRGKEEK